MTGNGRVAWAAAPAWITDARGQLLFEVLDLGPVIGKGANGEVHAAQVRLLDGTEMMMAVKVQNQLAPKAPLTDAQTRLARLFQAQSAPHVHTEIGGLRLQVDGKVRSVVVSQLVRGSINQFSRSFRLSPSEVDLRARLLRVSAVMTDVAEGLRELSAAGVAHGDIKPHNIFYAKTETGGRFLIGDLDGVQKTGSSRRAVGTETYLPPEYFNRGIRASSASRDAFALASTVYEMAFEAFPWEDFVTRDPNGLRSLVNRARAELGSFPELKQEYLRRMELAGSKPADVAAFLVELSDTHVAFGQKVYLSLQQEIYADPERYRQMQRFVDDRFRQLAEAAPEAERARIDRLREFVRLGLATDSRLRERALQTASRSGARVSSEQCTDRYAEIFSQVSAMMLN